MNAILRWIDSLLIFGQWICLSEASKIGLSSNLRASNFLLNALEIGSDLSVLTLHISHPLLRTIPSLVFDLFDLLEILFRLAFRHRQPFLNLWSVHTIYLWESREEANQPKILLSSNALRGGHYLSLIYLRLSSSPLVSLITVPKSVSFQTLFPIDCGKKCLISDTSSFTKKLIQLYCLIGSFDSLLLVVFSLKWLQKVLELLRSVVFRYLLATSLLLK